jgi:putative redox protein
MTETRLPLAAELVWSEHLQFGAISGGRAIVVDGDGQAGPSPMQALAFGIAGCMAADVVAILTKGRHPLTGLRVTFSGTRAETPPRYFTSIEMVFHVSGAVPPEAVDRAIALSRERYCSALNSLRPDTELHLRSVMTP